MAADVRSDDGSWPPANQGPHRTPVPRVNASPLTNRRQAGRKKRPPRNCEVLCRCYKVWMVVVMGHPACSPLASDKEVHGGLNSLYITKKKRFGYG